MLRTTSLFAGALIVLFTTSQATAQFTGGTTQGAGAATQGTGAGLSERFSSNFERFQAGSTSSGTVGVATSQVGLNANDLLGINATRGLTGAGLGGLGGGGFGGGFGGGRGGLNAFGVLGGQGGVQGGQQQQQTIRTKLVIGFTPRRPMVSAVVARTFETRVNRMSRFTFVEPVTVVLEEGRAVLRGAVTSEHERDLIEQIARFEPGIDEIENEIHVAPRPAGGETLPLPSGPIRRP